MNQCKNQSVKMIICSFLVLQYFLARFPLLLWQLLPPEKIVQHITLPLLVLIKQTKHNVLISELYVLRGGFH